MAHLAKVVQQWPSLTSEQRDLLAALLNPRSITP
jgi:hypothetical protein